MSGAGVVHYHSLHRPRSVPTALGPAPLVTESLATIKVFERLLKNHICSSIPVTLDPLQFAYPPNRSTDDAISQVLHLSLTHIDSKNGNYVRLPFIDYSSAFNTIVPIKLAVKLTDLGLNSSLCDWIQDFHLLHPEGRSTTVLCPESPALLSLHIRLRVLSQLHFYC